MTNSRKVLQILQQVQICVFFGGGMVCGHCGKQKAVRKIILKVETLKWADPGLEVINWYCLDCLNFEAPTFIAFMVIEASTKLEKIVS